MIDVPRICQVERYCRCCAILTLLKRKFRRWLAVAALIVVGLHLMWGVALVALRFIDPPTTGVQIQRRVEAIFTRGPYKKRYTFVPLRRISPQLQHAVIAAEDGNFYR